MCACSVRWHAVKPGTDSGMGLLVDVGTKHSSFLPGGLVADLEELLGRRIDVVELEGLHLYLREQILHEAVPL